MTGRAASWLVVGGGTAGCVVAARLSECADFDVTVLEAGPDHGPTRNHEAPLLDEPGRLWPSCRVVRRRGADPEPYAQGFGLGGSSLVNGAIAGGRADVDADHRDVGHLLPLEVERRSGPVGDAVRSATDDALPVLATRRDGERVTAADAYLRPVIHRPNLDVRVGEPVRRILLDGSRAVGAVTSAGSEVLADRVVMCAGAIQTPALLLRSGIAAPGIGAGVQDHPSVAITLELEPGAIDPSMPSIGALVDRPGRQILAMNRLADNPSYGALLPAVTDVSSRGRVSLPDPEGEPLVELRELDDPSDLDALVVVVREALQLARHPALRAVTHASFVDHLGTPVDELAGAADAVLREWLPDHLGGYHHVAASCRMGFVTSDDGAVRGYESLYICDASLFDGVPSTGTYVPVILLAERLAERWRIDLRARGQPSAG